MESSSLCARGMYARGGVAADVDGGGCWLLAPRMECAKNSLRMLSDMACDVLPETEGLLLYLCIK